MVKADDSWTLQQNSAWNVPDLNYMSTLLQSGQRNGLQSYMNSRAFSANVASPWFAAAAGLPGLKTGQANGARGLFPCLPPHLECLPSTPNPYLKEKQSASSYGLKVKATPNAETGPVQRGFLIFDQSESQTRLFFSPVSSRAPNPFIEHAKPIRASDLHDEKQPAKIEQIFPTKPTFEEKLYENRIIGEGSEVHEDTEEINALLYSEDDDGGSDDDDEVTSTGHFPFTIKGSYEKHEHVEEITEEVASSDGPIKRQRLLDGGYKKSSLMDFSSSVLLHRSWEYDDDAESSCADGRTQEKDLGSFLGNKQSRKDKIRETLRILESIIPGVKSKNPLLAIDEAINYLKSLKLKAKALGVSYP